MDLWFATLALLPLLGSNFGGLCGRSSFLGQLSNRFSLCRRSLGRFFLCRCSLCRRSLGRRRLRLHLTLRRLGGERLWLGSLRRLHPGRPNHNCVCRTRLRLGSLRRLDSWDLGRRLRSGCSRHCFARLFFLSAFRCGCSFLYRGSDRLGRNLRRHSLWLDYRRGCLCGGCRVLGMHQGGPGRRQWSGCILSRSLHGNRLRLASLQIVVPGFGFDILANLDVEIPLGGVRPRSISSSSPPRSSRSSSSSRCVLGLFVVVGPLLHLGLATLGARPLDGHLRRRRGRRMRLQEGAHLLRRGQPAVNQFQEDGMHNLAVGRPAPA